MDFTDRASIVEDFWLAVARNDGVEASAAVLRLEAPMVEVSTSYSYDFEFDSQFLTIQWAKR